MSEIEPIRIPTNLLVTRMLSSGDPMGCWEVLLDDERQEVALELIKCFVRITEALRPICDAFASLADFVSPLAELAELYMVQQQGKEDSDK